MATPNLLQLVRGFTGVNQPAFSEEELRLNRVRPVSAATSLADTDLGGEVAGAMMRGLASGMTGGQLGGGPIGLGAGRSDDQTGMIPRTMEAASSAAGTIGGIPQATTQAAKRMILGGQPAQTSGLPAIPTAGAGARSMGDVLATRLESLGRLLGLSEDERSMSLIQEEQAAQQARGAGPGKLGTDPLRFLSGPAQESMARLRERQAMREQAGQPQQQKEKLTPMEQQRNLLQTYLTSGDITQEEFDEGMANWKNKLLGREKKKEDILDVAESKPAEGAATSEYKVGERRRQGGFVYEFDGKEWKQVA